MNVTSEILNKSHCYEDNLEEIYRKSFEIFEITKVNEVNLFDEYKHIDYRLMT